MSAWAQRMAQADAAGETYTTSADAPPLSTPSSPKRVSWSPRLAASFDDDDLGQLQASLAERRRQLSKEHELLNTNTALAGALLSVAQGLQSTGPLGSQRNKIPSDGLAKESIRASRNRAMRSSGKAALSLTRNSSSALSSHSSGVPRAQSTAMPSTQHVRESVGAALLKQLLDSVLGTPTEQSIETPDGNQIGAGSANATAHKPAASQSAADHGVVSDNGGSTPTYVPTAAIEASFRALDALARDISLNDRLLAVPPAAPAGSFAPSNFSTKDGNVPMDGDAVDVDDDEEHSHQGPEPPRTVPLYASDRFRWVDDAAMPSSANKGDGQPLDETAAALARLLGVSSAVSAKKYAHVLGLQPAPSTSRTGAIAAAPSSTAEDFGHTVGRSAGSDTLMRTHPFNEGDARPESQSTVKRSPSVEETPSRLGGSRWLDRSALSAFAKASYESKDASAFQWQPSNDGSGRTADGRSLAAEYATSRPSPDSSGTAPHTRNDALSAERLPIQRPGAPEWLSKTIASATARSASPTRAPSPGQSSSSHLPAYLRPNSGDKGPYDTVAAAAVLSTASSPHQSSRPAASGSAYALLTRAATSHYSDALAGASGESVSRYMAKPPSATVRMQGGPARKASSPALGRAGDLYGTAAIEALGTSRALYAAGAPMSGSPPKPAVTRDRHGVFTLVPEEEPPAPIYRPRPLLSATGQPVPAPSARERHLPLRDEGGGYAGFGGTAVAQPGATSAGAPGFAVLASTGGSSYGVPAPRIPVKVLIRP